jgi:hypothetical protein
MSDPLNQKEKFPVQKYFPFARSFYGEDLLEDFLVAAVASVLLIRLYLSLTGYPQLSFGSLHVAHMLWGGLLMLAALFTSLGFLSRPAHEWAAVLGGFGFGAFIDELGKFLTNDNNYFFQPAIAIIYVLFVLIYLFIRTIFNRRPLSRGERLANAFELMQQGSINGLNSEEEKAILIMLEHCDQNDPLVGHLREMLPHIKMLPSRRPNLINRLKDRLEDFYQTVTARWWFAGVVIAFFTFTAITGFSAALGAIERPWSIVLAAAALGIALLGLLQVWKGHQPNLQIPLSGSIIVITLLIIWVTVANRQKFDLPFADWVLFVCSSLSAALIVTGIVLMGWSRLSAYQMFHRAILVSLLLTTVFAFYTYQFYALIGVFLNTLILFALRYMIVHEKLNKTNSIKRL